MYAYSWNDGGSRLSLQGHSGDSLPLARDASAIHHPDLLDSDGSGQLHVILDRLGQLVPPLRGEVAVEQTQVGEVRLQFAERVFTTLSQGQQSVSRLDGRKDGLVVERPLLRRLQRQLERLAPASVGEVGDDGSEGIGD